MKWANGVAGGGVGVREAPKSQSRVWWDGEVDVDVTLLEVDDEVGGRKTHRSLRAADLWHWCRGSTGPVGATPP